MSAGSRLRTTSTPGTSRRFDNTHKTVLKPPGDRVSKVCSSPLSTTPSPNYFDVLLEVEDELLLDAAGNAPIPGLDSTADLDLAPAIALSLDAKEKNPQTR